MGSKWTVELAKFPAFRKILRDAALASGALAATALYQEALKIMNVSQRQVPVRFGVLRSTGHVYPPTRQGRWIEVLLAYGGPAAPYAWLQHEKINLRHDSPYKAKYLEDPVLAAKDTIAGSLSNRMSFLFRTNQVLGKAWPTQHWVGPPASRTRKAARRRSPRRM